MILIVSATACQGDDGGERGALAGLTDCGAAGAPVAAFWGSTDGIGYPDDEDPDTPSAWDIWTMTVTGEVEAVTHDGRSRDPSMSDDARRLYFSRSIGGFLAGVAAPGTELWVRDLFTGEERMLLETGNRVGVESFEESPDGTAVAIAATLGSPKTSSQRLYVLDPERPDTPTPSPVAGADGYRSLRQSSPTWSPDGSQLAYVLVQSDRSTTFGSSLRIIDLASGTDSLLYQPRIVESHLHGLQWSSDGRSILATEKLGSQAYFSAISIDVETGQRSLLVDRVPDNVTYVDPDGVTVAQIGLTIEQINDRALPREPVVTTWATSGAITQNLPRHFAFTQDLTIADCAHTRSHG